MKFNELFNDMLETEIADDIAPYFKQQVISDLNEFKAMSEFVAELKDKVEARNDKNR